MDNRINILNTALKLFANKGYEAVGVQEICSCCAITKPTLYHYFGSKLGLLETIMSEYYPHFLDEIKKCAHYSHNITENLESIAWFFIRFTQSNPDFCRLSLSAFFSAPETELFHLQKQYADLLHSIIETLFINATPDHGNMRNRQRLLALSFSGLLRNYAGLCLSHEMKPELTAVRAIVKQYMHGIFS